MKRLIDWSSFLLATLAVAGIGKNALGYEVKIHEIINEAIYHVSAIRPYIDNELKITPADSQAFQGRVEGNVAQYRVRREQLWEGAPQTITYYVWFVRDADGLWRIDKF